MVTKLAIAALVALVLPACESAPPDRTRLPVTASSKGMSVLCIPVTGTRASALLVDGTRYEGELLAASDDAIVLLLEDVFVRRLKASEVSRVDLHIYSNGDVVALLSIWAVIGTVSALSHGYYFLISGPSWAVVSTASIAAVAADPDRFVTVQSVLGRLHQYARFPSGLPEGIDDGDRRRVRATKTCN